jgi:DNA-binding CsgD family transcriptional regulator
MSRMARSEALSTCQTALDDAIRCGGKLIVVTGGLASGKTALITTLLRRAESEGALTLAAAGHRADASIPLVLIEQLIRSGALDPDAETRLRARLLSARPHLDPSDDAMLCESAESLHATFGRELCGAILDRARTRPVVIGVDDVHFGDPCSQRVLLYLWRRLRSAPVVLVLGQWLWPNTSSPTFDAHLRRLQHVRITLQPLSVESLATLAGRFLPATSAQRLAPRLSDLTGGNPLLASALIAEHRMGHETPSADGPFARAILTGLSRWGDELLDVAQAAAVLSDEADVSLIARLMDRDPSRVADVLTVLGDAGFLTGCSFRTEIARRAVLTSLTSARRTALNERAAAVLLAAGRPALAVSQRLVEAGSVSGNAGVTALRVTAEQLLTQGRPGEALRCLQLAQESTEDDGIRTAVLAATLRAAWRVRPSAATSPYPLLKSALRDRRLSSSDVIGLLRHTAWHALAADTEVSLASCLASCIEVCRLAGIGSAPAQARAVYSWVLPLPRTDGGGARRRPADTLWAHRLDPQATAWAGNCLADARVDDTNLEVIGTALLILARAGQAGEALAATHDLLQQAQAAGAPVWQAFLAEAGARAALLAEDADQALRLVRTALQLLSPPEWGVCLGWPIGTQALAELQLGHPDRAARSLRLALPRRGRATLPGLWHRRARGLCNLAQGRVLAGLGDLQAVSERAAELGLPPTDMIPWDEELAWAERRFVDRTIRDLGRYPADGVRPRSVSLQVLAACGGQQDTVRTDPCAPAEPPRQHPLPAARDTADPCPIRNLSGAEMRVVRLAAAGYTNREIGRRLYLTVSTVEQHLTKAYRKLGVTGRAGLGALRPELQPSACQSSALVPG